MRTRNWNSASAAVSTASAPEAPGGAVETKPPGKAITYLLAAYVFILASRILDVSSIAHLRIPLMLFILIALVTLGMAVQHGIHGFLNNKACFCFAGLTAWTVLAFPLSEWRAFSLPFVQTSVQGLVIFAAVVQIGSTVENWRRMAMAFACATFVASVLSFYVGASVGGRLALGNGTLADPNEFALSLAIGLPFLLYAARSSKPIIRIPLYCCIPVILWCFARTGSRGGLIALAAVMAVLFLFSGVSQKVMMIILLVAGVAAAGVMLPTYLRDRFLTFFSPATTSLSASMQERLDSDIDSSESRKQLLIQSIHITFQHPLLGVGPGNFAWEAAAQRKEQVGFSGSALVTHNTYTEYSSETGIAGFIFWVGTLYFCVKYVLRAYRRTSGVDRNLSRAARDTLAALVGLAVGSLFLSLAYGLKIPILLGLAVALHNVAEAQMSKSQAPEASAAVPVAAGFMRPPAASRDKRVNPLPPRRPGRHDLSGRPRARNFD